ncbi:MAG: LptA/OstA family protein [Microcoleaceae cyanobacterium]
MILNYKISKSIIFKGLVLILPLAMANAIASPISAQINPTNPPPPNQNSSGRTLTVRSDIQEADSKTGVVTARGNVQINYPARNIQATAAQAQFFSRERRIVLSGNVFVLQDGNTIRGETVTYLIDEGRFIALPQSQGQVESIYLVPAGQGADAEAGLTAPFNPKPAFKSPISP